MMKVNDKIRNVLTSMTDDEEEIERRDARRALLGCKKDDQFCVHNSRNYWYVHNQRCSPIHLASRVGQVVARYVVRPRIRQCPGWCGAKVVTKQSIFEQCLAC